MQFFRKRVKKGKKNVKMAKKNVKRAKKDKIFGNLGKNAKKFENILKKGDCTHTINYQKRSW